MIIVFVFSRNYLKLGLPNSFELLRYLSFLPNLYLQQDKELSIGFLGLFNKDLFNKRSHRHIYLSTNLTVICLILMP